MPEEIEPKPEEIIEEQPKAGFLEKLKTHKFKILAGILGVLVFAGAVFGAYKLGQRQVSPELVEGPTPTPEVVATPTPDPTANWEIYTNQTYGYSIKYPQDWLLYEINKEGVKLQNFQEPTEPYGGFAGGPKGISVGLSIKKNPQNLSLNDWFETVEAKGRVVRTKDFTPVLEREAIRATFAQEIGAGQPNIYLKRNLNIFCFTASYGEEAEAEALHIFNLMLSTFRFLE